MVAVTDFDNVSFRIPLSMGLGVYIPNDAVRNSPFDPFFKKLRLRPNIRNDVTTLRALSIPKTYSNLNGVHTKMSGEIELHFNVYDM